MLVRHQLFCFSGALSEEVVEADPASASVVLKHLLSVTVHGEYGVALSDLESW
jgi:hypothetical protein